VDKAKGVIATQVERGDHGGQMDLVAMQVATAKLLNNTLRLAEVLIMQAWFLGDMALAELKPSK